MIYLQFEHYLKPEKVENIFGDNNGVVIQIINPYLRGDGLDSYISQAYFRI